MNLMKVTTDSPEYRAELFSILLLDADLYSEITGLSCYKAAVGSRSLLRNRRAELCWALLVADIYLRTAAKAILKSIQKCVDSIQTVRSSVSFSNQQPLSADASVGIVSFKNQSLLSTRYPGKCTENSSLSTTARSARTQKYPVSREIIKIMQAGSGKGISMLSCVFELLAISANAAAYGEGVFLGIQSAIVIVLVLLYGGRTLGGILFVLLYTATMGFLISPMAPKELIAAMQGANIIIVMASKLIQAYANYSNGGTGQLSGITVFMLWAGSLARIFTSIQETGDTMTVVTYMAAFSCNCVLVSQMVYYSKKSKTE
ncbi:MPU1-like protein [Mya arenaria]|uniref:MPU1-like protein n=1 Tax=Mya arenaria TaxID=6604 RepID=A0ABY7G732_MYAAR|nr:MPU1-like protein [Mya arenaria]